MSAICVLHLSLHSTVSLYQKILNQKKFQEGYVFCFRKYQFKLTVWISIIQWHFVCTRRHKIYLSYLFALHVNKMLFVTIYTWCKHYLPLFALSVNSIYLLTVHVNSHCFQRMTHMELIPRVQTVWSGNRLKNVFSLESYLGNHGWGGIDLCGTRIWNDKVHDTRPRLGPHVSWEKPSREKH